MTREELLKKLLEIADTKGSGDTELNHVEADELLLEFINDPEITEAFEKINKWYA